MQNIDRYGEKIKNAEKVKGENTVFRKKFLKTNIQTKKLKEMEQNKLQKDLTLFQECVMWVKTKRAEGERQQKKKKKKKKNLIYEFHLNQQKFRKKARSEL